MHQSIITRILDLAAQKVAAQVTTDAGIEALARQIDPVAISKRVTDRVANELNTRELVDRVAELCSEHLDRRELARDVAAEIDTSDFAQDMCDHLDLDDVAQKVAENLNIDEDDVIEKAADMIVEQFDAADVTNAAVQQINATDLLDTAAAKLVDRVCAALMPTDSTEKPQPNVAA